MHWGNDDATQWKISKRAINQSANQPEEDWKDNRWTGNNNDWETEDINGVNPFHPQLHLYTLMLKDMVTTNVLLQKMQRIAWIDTAAIFEGHCDPIQLENCIHLEISEKFLL
jgi:hypothetical protein